MLLVLSLPQFTPLLGMGRVPRTYLCLLFYPSSSLLCVRHFRSVPRTLGGILVNVSGLEPPAQQVLCL